jgi:hypothetical protein
VREHRVVKADGRFLQLVGIAKGKLEARPRELRSQELANMLNGERVGRSRQPLVLMSSVRVEVAPTIVLCLCIRPALAKIGHHMPGEEFLKPFLGLCAAMGLKGFKPVELAIIINGEREQHVRGSMRANALRLMRLRMDQASRS